MVWGGPQPWESAFSFPHVGPEDQIQVVRFDGEQLYSLSNLTKLIMSNKVIPVNLFILLS